MKKKLSTEDLAEMWREDEEGEYVAVNDNGEAFHIAHGSRMEQIQPMYGNLFAGIRAWMAKRQYWPNVWQINERGNLELLNSSTGKSLGGLV